MDKPNFLIEAERCTGCMLCVIACKDEHVGAAYPPWTRAQPDTGQFWIDVKPVERGRIPRVRVSYLPVLCQHCANAPCIKACPEGAIQTREDGLVWIDPAACTACGLCVDACPYDVVYMNAEAGVAQKCTGCAHRVDAGEIPRCAEVCPHDAILFGDDAEQGSGGPVEVFHPEFETEPRVYWRGLPKPWIAGSVVDARDDEVIADVSVTVVDLFATGSAAARTDAFGDFWIRGLAADRKYRVEIGKEGYDAFLAVVTTDGDQDLGTVRLNRTD